MEAGQEVTRAVWTRTGWTPAVENALGGLISGDRAAILGDVVARRADVYQVQGWGYSGHVLMRFEERRSDARLDCHVLAIAGHGLPAALADLVRICGKLGNVASIRFESESDAHHRLYESAGAREGWRVYLVDIE